jgi:hypothetical protein
MPPPAPGSRHADDPAYERLAAEGWSEGRRIRRSGKFLDFRAGYAEAPKTGNEDLLAGPGHRGRGTGMHAAVCIWRSPGWPRARETSGVHRQSRIQMRIPGPRLRTERREMGHHRAQAALMTCWKLTWDRWDKIRRTDIEHADVEDCLPVSAFDPSCQRRPRNLASPLALTAPGARPRARKPDLHGLASPSSQVHLHADRRIRYT